MLVRRPGNGMFAGFGHTIPRATLLVCYVAHGSYKRECPRSANAAGGVVGEGIKPRAADVRVARAAVRCPMHSGLPRDAR